MINKYHRTLYILEFKRSSDRNMDFLRIKEGEANERHRSIIEALRAAALEWTYEHINFEAGRRRRGAVVEDDGCWKGQVQKIGSRKITHPKK